MPSDPLSQLIKKVLGELANNESFHRGETIEYGSGPAENVVASARHDSAAEAFKHAQEIVRRNFPAVD